MQWKYCEERFAHRYYWKASGLINGHRVELIIEDDWDDGPYWKVESHRYGTYFSKKMMSNLDIAKEEAEAFFYNLYKQYEGKDEFE